MNEAKFTKGPWFVRWGGDCRAIKTSAGCLIMGNERYYPWVPSSGHDWNLIASAPDMYHMLQEIYETLGDEYSEELDKIETVLAKARGEK